MTIIKRRGLICHYCGLRNNSQNVRYFKCKSCLADNFFDENGEIADVPSEVVQSPEQYAIPVQTFDSSQSIFCSTCLKNQYLYTDALSHFLPDPESPEYDRFEDALPEFKKRMEKQYPQCCIDCEPKVKEQLQQATYNARSDHLRRVLDRSRSRSGRTWGWRSLIVNGAGLGYFLSLSIQLLWHAMGSQSRGVVANVRPTDCFTRWPTTDCPKVVEQFMGTSLFLGVICAWWNPKWQHKLKAQQGRLMGLTSYYQAQAMVLGIRFAVWVILRDVPELEHHRPMIHSLSLVSIILVAGYTNLGIIKLDTTPLVDWQQKSTPLLVNGQFEPHIEAHVIPQNSILRNLQTIEPRLEAWRPPTPPNEDAMDWAPSSSNFIPQPKKLVYKSVQPSPFVGTLPALPKQGIFANRAQNQSEPAKAIGIPQGFFDKRDHLKKSQKEDKTFAQPKFFPKNSDTGLENIFDKVFSLDEDVIEVRKLSTSTTRSDKYARPHPNVMEKLFHAISVVVLGATAAHTVVKSYTGLPVDYRLIGCTAVIPAVDAVLELRRNVDNARTLLYLMECSGIAGLIFSCPDESSPLTPLWSKLGTGMVSWLLIQEIYHFCKTTPSYQIRQDYSEQIETDSTMKQAEAEPEPQSNPPDLFGNTQATSAKQPIHTNEQRPYNNPSTPRFNRSRRDSVESVSSISSLGSTSTSSTWKTPVVNHRATPNTTRVTRSSTSRDSGFGFETLGLEDFSIGSNVAGPRNRSKHGQARK